jgi:hypothetical protein
MSVLHRPSLENAREVPFAAGAVLDALLVDVEHIDLPAADQEGVEVVVRDLGRGSVGLKGGEEGGCDDGGHSTGVSETDRSCLEVLVRSRKVRGPTPHSRRNAFVKWLWSKKPRSSASALRSVWP